MDHELMTSWLSVDPMADKYPSISPYAYCAWIPVRLLDPDGREINPVYTVEGKIATDVRNCPDTMEKDLFMTIFRIEPHRGPSRR